MRRRTRLALAAAPALVLAACTPEAPRLPPMDGPPPHRVWLPEEPPRAVILALHGFNDYSNAFERFGHYAVEHGVAVHAYDQPGFGAQRGAGRWPGIPALLAELRREHQRIVELHPERPVYLLGESMGAAVLIAAAARDELPEVAGTILSAPAVWGGEQLNPIYRASLWLAVRFVPGLTLTGRDLGIMASDNIEMLRGLGADPMVIKSTRIDAVAGLVALMDTAHVHAGAVPGPLLVLGGAQDQIVPPRAHAATLERLTAAPCTEVVYPDGWHMLLRDLQRQVVWDDILAWIDGEPLPSGQAGECGASLSSVAARFDRF
jgi:acylglycerol lipase